MKTERTWSVYSRVEKNIASILSRFSIKSILVGGFTTLIVLSFIMVLLARRSEEYAFQMMTKFINADNVVSDLCLKSNTAMIDARRNEKDFLLTYREFGFNESKSRYITRVLTDLEDIKHYMKSVRLIANDPDITRQTREVDPAVDQYRTGLLAFVDMYGTRGYGDTGLEGAFRAEAHEVENILSRRKSNLLLADLLSVRTKEKDFIERSADADVQQFHDALSRFKADIAQSGLPVDVKKGLNQHTSAYSALFDRYVRTTEKIRTVKRSYLKSVQAVDPVLEKLYVYSIERVRASRARMEKTARFLDLLLTTVGLFIFLFSVFLTSVITRIISRSVVESKTFAEKIASGNLDHRLTPRGNNEFFALSASLNKMAESLQTADIAQQKWNAELRESEQRFRSIFEHANDGILLADPENKKFIAGNEMICRMLGYSSAEIENLGVADIHPEEGLPHAIDTFEKQLRDEETLATNIPVKRKNGTFFYADINAFKITLTGKTYLIGFFRDVTGRKQAEDQIKEALMEKDILLKEIHHRVKNNLQVVASMLELQSGYIRDSEAKLFFEESQRRVETMSLIHDKLYRSKDLARIDFGEYVDDLTANLFAINAGRLKQIDLKTDIRGITLDVNKAIPCGLIINELVSNVFRHAFRDGRKGELAVVMHVNQQGEITLAVSDNGMGFPENIDFRNTRSLGLQLVISLVHQLKGTIELEKNGGTAFRISFHGTNEGRGPGNG